MANRKITEVPATENLNSSDSLIISQNNILKQISKTNIMNILYPVNSTYVTSTNENPSSYLGGTWTLYDKQFSYKYFSGKTDDSPFTPTSNTSSYNLYLHRYGHELHMKFSITPAVDITDTAILLGTLDYDTLGVVKLPYTISVPAQCDGGNSIVMMQLAHETGELKTLDAIGDTNHAMASGKELVYIISTTIAPVNMKDSACDKFFWKRTA